MSLFRDLIKGIEEFELSESDFGSILRNTKQSDDIDLENRLIYIRYKKDWVPKNSQEREIPINDTLFKLINKLRNSISKDNYIFDLQGRQQKEHLLENLHIILEKYGFEYGRLHTFRHTFGTKLA